MTVEKNMKEHPLLLNAAMVRAVMSGRKTQTRRPVRYPICPFGNVGDLLWVRECWALIEQPGVPAADACPVYRATDPGWAEMAGRHWRPSIHMPKRVCRIRLRVLRVWVKRIQEITEEDAKAEGCVLPRGYEALCMPVGGLRAVFRDLWESIYPGSWHRNEVAWCCEFEKTEVEE